jgi:hypothetical protein
MVRVGHNDCRLGKWYEGPGKEVFGDTPSFRKLAEPHSKVHAHAHEMLRLIDSDWTRNLDTQDKIFEALSGTEQASLEVMRVIDQLVAEKHSGMTKN